VYVYLPSAVAFAVEVLRCMFINQILLNLHSEQRSEVKVSAIDGPAMIFYLNLLI
jgi:hypothetical protein